ncbi:unnamed protein product [Periconia digitata]|uniref:Large ribosomal subunit protein bL34m n=1 Tax=Periconia digitata TaxID=1303443 RepID=A0A9W4XZ85_9PLEO|nr:unnamed protein product [Periconia digitata]
MNAFRYLQVATRPATLRTCLLRPTTNPSTALPPRTSTSATRSISLLAPRRPILPPSSSPLALPSPGSSSSGVIPSAAALDLAPKISLHPALGSTQIRCGPRDTYNPSHIVRKRRHGFLARIRTKKGRKLLMRRLKKGRWNLSH